ncbi:MAG: LysR family transcriptional regulator [Oscillospiraceae bacterium]|nr:LysR family transcriptional regulator [Oscillospiraceae bacterium]
MTQTEIACFLAICRHKTGIRAAEALYITQPSLSTRLKTLEKELGCKLFFRNKGSREMILTPAGQVFYPLALEYEALIQKMQNISKEQQEKLRVSSLDSLDTFLLPQVYESFLQQYPHIRLELQDMDVGPASESIHAGTTDLAFTTAPNTDRGLKQTLLFHEPMVLICSTDAPLEGVVSRTQLAAVPEVFIDWSQAYVRWHQQTLGILPKLSVSIMSHLQQFLEKGNCWSIVPASVAYGLEQRCAIRRLETVFPLPRREVSYLTSAEAEQNEAVLAFCRCLRETVARYPEFTV